MTRNIVSLNKYCLFTFKSTTHALKAEKILLANSADFIIMPTLREITASCGLSVKMDNKNWRRYAQILKEHQIIVDKIYSVQKMDQDNQIKELCPE